MNIVRANEAVFNALNTVVSCGYNWVFTYARMDYANLKVTGDQYYHGFIESFDTRSLRDSDGIKGGEEHRYVLKILTDSLFDIQVFNELDPSDAKSKFSEYVEPLLECFEDAYESELCKLGFSLTRFIIKTKYNAKDQNMDGIQCEVVVRYGDT